MRKVWVVTWEAMGDRRPHKPKLIAVFSARVGVQRIKEFVEHVYGAYSYTDGEKLEFALKAGANLYTAFQNRIGPMALDQVTCGHNPYVYARKVFDPRIDSRGRLEWDEIPPPEVPAAALREFERLMGREPHE